MREALIVWGGWEGHEPRQGAEVVKDMLEAAGFGVRVENSTAAFADPNLKDLSLIVPIVTMSTIEKDELANLEAAVRGGVGLAGYHGGMGDSFRNAPLYQFMVGGQWVAPKSGRYFENISPVTGSTRLRSQPRCLASASNFFSESLRTSSFCGLT